MNSRRPLMNFAMVAMLAVMNFSAFASNQPAKQETNLDRFPNLVTLAWGNSGPFQAGEKVAFWLNGSQNGSTHACRIVIQFGDGSPDQTIDAKFDSKHNGGTITHAYYAVGTMKIKAIPQGKCKMASGGTFAGSEVEIKPNKITQIEHLVLSVPAPAILPKSPVKIKVTGEGPSCPLKLHFGDGKTNNYNNFSFANAAVLSTEHKYELPGTYQIKAVGTTPLCIGEVSTSITVVIPISGKVGL